MPEKVLLSAIRRYPLARYRNYARHPAADHFAVFLHGQFLRSKTTKEHPCNTATGDCRTARHQRCTLWMRSMVVKGCPLSRRHLRLQLDRRCEQKEKQEHAVNGAFCGLCVMGPRAGRDSGNLLSTSADAFWTIGNVCYFILMKS